jgi:hypothetical protein
VDRILRRSRLWTSPVPLIGALMPGSPTRSRSLNSYTPIQTRDTTQTHPNDSGLVSLNLDLGQFEAPLCVNSSDYQIYFVEHQFGGCARVVGLAGHTKFPCLLQILAAGFWREMRRPGVSEEENLIARTTRGSRHPDCSQAAVLVSEGTVSVCIPELPGVPRQTQHPQVACQVSADRETPRNDRALGVPALVMGGSEGRAR